MLVSIFKSSIMVKVFVWLFFFLAHCCIATLFQKESQCARLKDPLFVSLGCFFHLAFFDKMKMGESAFSRQRHRKFSFSFSDSIAVLH